MTKNSDEIRRLIINNTVEINNLRNQVKIAHQNRHKSDKDYIKWRDACENLLSQYDNLAFPGGYKGAFDRILNGDEYTIEVAICFLETRPYFFRSGYMFKDIFRKLKRASLNNNHKNRFNIICEKIDKWKSHNTKML